MIQESYVSFEVAKLLKEKGFDGKCRYYYPDGHTQLISYVDCVQSQMFGNDACIAPTQQMAMKWLREVHHLHISILYFFPFNYVIDIFRIEQKTYIEEFEQIRKDSYPTCEEAEEAAIKYCLENLI